jgi:thioredoxin reductase (NADPH)
MSEPTDRDGAFPRLTDAQRAWLRAIGRSRAVRQGDILFREGDCACDLVVIESGTVALVSRYGSEDRVIAVHGRHRFLGELNLITGGVTYLTAIVRDPGEIVEVPLAELRSLIARDDDLAKLILRAYLARRSILVELGAGVSVIGSPRAADSQRVRDFLVRNRVPHRWVDATADDETMLARAMVGEEHDFPLVTFGERMLRNPSNAELAALLRIGARARQTQMFDLMIVGGGPAGLAAAVYGASEGLETAALDQVAFGGQAGTSTRIENYLGFPAGVSGANLTERAILQARKFGARLIVAASAVGLMPDGDGYAVTADGRAYRARTVLVATGARYRRLAVPGVERFLGAGVYYAATPVEAQGCLGGPTIVVGGGSSAGQAALYLSRRSISCHIVVRGATLAASMSQYLIDQIEATPNITVLTGAEITAVDGDDSLREITISIATSAGPFSRRLDATGLYVFIGAKPCTEWLNGSLATDAAGFLLTGRDLPDDALGHGRRGPLSLETSWPGVFAAGDVHAGSVKRVASAVGEGASAVSQVHRRLGDPVPPVEHPPNEHTHLRGVLDQ